MLAYDMGNPSSILLGVAHYPLCSLPGYGAGWQWTGLSTTTLHFDHEIIEIGLICSNLIEKKPLLQQSWAEP
jgi:hypothetical protein